MSTTVPRLTAAACTLTACLLAQGPPVITTNTLPRAVVGSPYSYTVLSSGGLRPYLFTASETQPPGITLSPDGTLSGRPTKAGAFSFDVTLTDARSATAVRRFTLAVAESVAGLAISTAMLPEGTAGRAYSHTLQAFGGVTPYRWSGTVPLGLTLDEGSGRLSGTPGAHGIHTFSVRVTDVVEGSATATYTLVIRPGPPPLVITTPANIFEGAVGTSYGQPFRASGGVPPYKWTVASGNIEGLKMDEATGDLQGVPQRVGMFTFTVQVTDSAGATVSQTYTMSVRGASLVLTPGGALPSGTVGVRYQQRLLLTVSGGRTPYTWSVVQGLPPGLALSPEDQTISGVPSAAGSFSFTVQVTDADGLSVSRQLGLTVDAGPLSIVGSRRLADGMLNEPFTATVEASGGLPPYRWLASGLPLGLTINGSTGQITGTPSQAGDFPLAITVVDSALANAADRFTLQVKMPALPRVSLSGLAETARAGEQFPLSITLDSPYIAPITGEAILTFTPDSGPIDRTIQFASGGTTAQLTIPAGTTTAVSTIPLMLQTGTVAGTTTVSLRLQVAGVDISPAPSMTARIERSAPVISNVTLSRSGNTLSLTIAGYSTAREVTQATFTFKASAGQTLQAAASSISIPVDGLFGPWFQNASSAQYGSQFLYTQPFTVEGDVNAIVPDTITLTNRLGSVTFSVR